MNIALDLERNTLLLIIKCEKKKRFTLKTVSRRENIRLVCFEISSKKKQILRPGYNVFRTKTIFRTEL